MGQRYGTGLGLDSFVTEGNIRYWKSNALNWPRLLSMSSIITLSEQVNVAVTLHVFGIYPVRISAGLPMADVFHGFPQSSQAMYGIVPSHREWLLSSIFLPTHDYLFISFHAVRWLQLKLRRKVT